MAEISVENNINQLVQEIERIEGILTNRDLYGMGLNPRGHGERSGLIKRNLDLFNSVGKVIYDKYHPISMESVVFEELLETKIAINIGAEEYKFYKSTIEKYKNILVSKNISFCGLFYHDIVILDAYVELFHSISERAKDLLKTMITDNIEEALDISTAIESLCIVEINPNLEEIVQLCMNARKLMNENKCANFKDAFAVLLNADINGLMEKKKQNAFVTPKDRILKLKQDGFKLIDGFGIDNDIRKRVLRFNIDKYLKDGNFENLSEICDLYVDFIINDDCIKNTLKIICKRLDLGEKITEQNKGEIKSNMVEYLENLDTQSFKNNLFGLLSPELTNTFDRLSEDKFNGLGEFIANTLLECYNEVETREKKENEERMEKIKKEEEARRAREEVEKKIQKARDSRRLKVQEITKVKETQIAQIRKEEEIEEKRKREKETELKVHEERARGEAEEQRIKAEKDIEIQKIREEMLKRKNEEKKAREKEMQKIIEEQQAEVQARCIQLLDTEILQENESNQEVNISGFESIIHANSKLSISTIYQSCIAGLIMFSVDRDPLKELFTEVDKIMSRPDIINKKNEISNKMKELGNEINDFLGQIGENDREKLKMYLSNPVLQRIFNEKTDNLYSKLILGQIITMMAGFEKNTRCCIY